MLGQLNHWGDCVSPKRIIIMAVKKIVRKAAKTTVKSKDKPIQHDSRKFVFTGLIEDSTGIKAHVNCFQHFGFFMTEDDLIFNIQQNGTDKELLKAINELQDALDRGGIQE